jgi:very-short-patch-repair endonuclease
MKRNANTVRRARENRGEQSACEEKLWNLLRGRRFHYRKFRREHTIGKYSVDFACPAVKLVIEIDGPSHNDPEQKRFDDARTEYLQQSGWRMIRFANAEIYDNLEGVAARIAAALGET